MGVIKPEELHSELPENAVNWFLDEECNFNHRSLNGRIKQIEDLNSRMSRVLYEYSPNHQIIRVWPEVRGAKCKDPKRFKGNYCTKHIYIKIQNNNGDDTILMNAETGIIIETLTLDHIFMKEDPSDNKPHIDISGRYYNDITQAEVAYNDRLEENPIDIPSGMPLNDFNRNTPHRLVPVEYPIFELGDMLIKTTKFQVYAEKRPENNQK